MLTENMTLKCIYYKNSSLGGIAITIDTKQEIIINKSSEHFALHLDEIEVQITTIDNASNEIYGKITNILKNNTHRLLGTIKFYKKQACLHVLDHKFGNYLVKINSELNAVPDSSELFNTEIINYPNTETPWFEVIVINSLGSYENIEVYIAKCIAENSIELEFNAEVLNYVAQLPDVNSGNFKLKSKQDYEQNYKQILQKKEEFRVDLRHLPFCTIDGADAKDFDDAVYCDSIVSSNGENLFNLYVAIADVAHYVTNNTALNDTAFSRSTSIYFPKQVIPMLPERLSNDLCSLRPHYDRLVMCVEMQIDQAGNVKSYKVYNAMINSHARLTYAQVDVWLNDLSLVPSELTASITNLYLVYQALINERKNRGAIDFEFEEPSFQFNSLGMVEKIIPFSRLEAHKLIEECMLVANITVADFIIKNNHAGLFRVHNKPTPEKFNNFKNYLLSLNLNLDVAYDDLQAKDYANFLKENISHKDYLTIQQAMLRSLQLAVYSDDHELGHFGLAYSHYLHFTSPIRRYPDLITHKICKAILIAASYNFEHKLEVLAEHTSLKERMAEDLERKITLFYKCQYAKQYVGTNFKGIITAITRFGIFVYLSDLMVDGLLHITELGEDEFVFDEKRTILISTKDNNKFYSNGQLVRVTIIGVDMAQLFIDLSLDN